MTIPKKTVLVTGGTGTLGRALVPLLESAGHDVRVLTRQGDSPWRGDLDTGDGVAEAVAGADVIVHLANRYGGDPAMTERLMAAARDSGARPHVVLPSIVGVDALPYDTPLDRMQFGYLQKKLQAEDAVRASGLPWTILRATQFHSLVATLARGLSGGPIALSMRGVRVQPVDAEDVAARLAELAAAEPAGFVEPIGGPRVYPLEDLVRSYLTATGRSKPVLRFPLAGRAAREYAGGANLAPAHADGAGTWEQYLERIA
jgi:uncharacterized protein YbjT (DUF2867 family)